MIAKLRLITNASAIEDAYMALEAYNRLSGDERRGLRRPRIPKYRYRYTPMVIDPAGVKLAYQEGDVIQLKHADNPEWLPIKNEPQVWEQIQNHLDNVRVKGFNKK